MDTELKAPVDMRRAELASEDWKESPGQGIGQPAERILGFPELRKAGCSSPWSSGALLIRKLKSPQ